MSPFGSDVSEIVASERARAQAAAAAEQERQKQIAWDQWREACQEQVAAHAAGEQAVLGVYRAAMHLYLDAGVPARTATNLATDASGSCVQGVGSARRVVALPTLTARVADPALRAAVDAARRRAEDDQRWTEAVGTVDAALTARLVAEQRITETAAAAFPPS